MGEKRALTSFFKREKKLYLYIFAKISSKFQFQVVCGLIELKFRKEIHNIGTYSMYDGDQILSSDEWFICEKSNYGCVGMFFLLFIVLPRFTLS